MEGGSGAGGALGAVMAACYDAVIGAADPLGRCRGELFKVLPDRIAYPDYYKIIARPIALDAIRERMASGAYGPSLDAFAADFRLMFANARTYNLAGSQVYQDAEALEAKFTTCLTAEATANGLAVPAKQAHATGAAKGASARAPPAATAKKPGSAAASKAAAAKAPETAGGAGGGDDRKRKRKPGASERGRGKRSRPRGTSALVQSPYPSAAYHVLDNYADGRPLHYKYITDKAIELDLVHPTGKTPSNTMNGQINKSDMFYAAGKGYFGLRKWIKHGELPPQPRPTVKQLKSGRAGGGTRISARSISVQVAAAKAREAAAAEAARRRAAAAGEEEEGDDDEYTDDSDDGPPRPQILTAPMLSSLHRTMNQGSHLALQGRQETAKYWLKKIMGYKELEALPAAP